MREFRLLASLCLLCAAALIALLPGPALSERPATRPAGGRTTVVWISVDGFRPDYLDRAATPFLHRLIKEGAYTRQLEPVCPSLTFPSHVSLATGVYPAEHGITGNTFFDASRQQTFVFPDDASLLEAEPIWLTATRQGLRVAQLDWPLSYPVAGQLHTAYSAAKFDKHLTDDQRLDRLQDIWRNETDSQGLQLLMGYVLLTDSAAHKFGPDSPDTWAAAATVDTSLQRFFDNAIGIFQRKKAPGDDLYFIITSDHGMAKVHTLVNFQRLFAPALPASVRVVDGSVLAHLFLDKVPLDQQAALAERILASLRSYTFLTAYRRAELPATWHYAHATRTGDIVVVLKPGYVFSSRPQELMTPAQQAGGPLGMHGYVPDACPDMTALAIFWHYPAALGGIDLGKIDSLQLHPTVAAMLHIQPAARAIARPLPLSAPTLIRPNEYTIHHQGDGPMGAAAAQHP